MAILLSKNIVYPIHALIIIKILFYSVNVFSLIESNLCFYNSGAQVSNAKNLAKELELFSINKKDDFTISRDSIQQFKIIAIEYANKGNAEMSIEFIKKYMASTGDLSILSDHLFLEIKDSEQYIALKNKYTPKFSFFSLLYFFAAFLGVFMFFLLNIKGNVDKLSTFLISLFVLFHSVFIMHLSLYVINYQYHFPHSLFLSTTFSFLYGPLLYFYFKRIINDYKFKWFDALHLIPSILLFALIFPYYAMTRLEKFNAVFYERNTILPGTQLIVIVKIISLTIYAYLIIRVYNRKKGLINKLSKSVYLWQRNIIVLFVIYIIAYIVYGGKVVKIINFPSLVHMQIIVMVAVVFYVTYISYVQPEIFKGKIKLLDPIDFLNIKNLD